MVKTKVFTGGSVSALLTWKEDLKVFVHWNYIFEQEPINPADIPDFLIRKVENYCFVKGLILWSY